MFGCDRRQKSEDARSPKYMLCRSLEWVCFGRKFLALSLQMRPALGLKNHKDKAMIIDQ